MNILMTCLSRSWGGMEMFVLTLSEQLIERGFSPSVACYPDSKIYQEAKRLNIPAVPVKAGGYFHPLEIIKFSSFLKSNKFDIVHSHYSKDLWTLVPALNLSGSKTPLILTKQLGSFIVKKDFLHKKLYNRVNMTTAISTVIKNNLLDTCPIDEEKVTIIFNATDTKRFDPAKVNRENIRKEFKITDNELVIGMSARFTEGKGHEEFLKAAEILNQKFDNLKFLFVGEPSRGEDTYGHKIVKMVEALEFKDKIIFTGFRTDMPDIYSAMDIFAFPSHAEAFGMALTEAMAMEKPGAASNSDGILDIIEHGVNGLMFENKNPDDLAEKLEQLISSGSEREKLGKEARKRVVEKFDLEKITLNFVELYNTLAKEK